MARSKSYLLRRLSSQAPNEASGELVEQLGFKKVEKQLLSEYDSTALLYRHIKTGAEVMSIANKDENKVFGIVFRTPPKKFSWNSSHFGTQPLMWIKEVSSQKATRRSFER